VSNFLTRTITGTLFVVVIVGSIIISHHLFSIVFLVITMLTLSEYYSLIKTEEVNPAKTLGMLLGSMVFLSFSLVAAETIPIKYLYLIIPMIILVYVFELYRNSKYSIANINYTISGVIYIALPFAILNFYFNPGFVPGESKYGILLGFFILVWLHDVGAYLVGSTLGRHKLFERISPKKTWEGTIGGTIVCVLVAYFLPQILGSLDTVNWIIVALIVVVFGTFGDLAESMVKRNMGVKDSGKMLPGHGGMLDRFDAVLFASPAVFAYLLLIS